MEAFTDGVVAVIITIMVLELKTPEGIGWHALAADLPVFLSYVLSFVYVGIYWNNHHHMLQRVEHVDGKVLWANLFVLFWLSLLPFATRWLNEAHPVPAAVPTAVYGIILLLAALSWIPLRRSLMAVNGGDESTLAKALRGDWKTTISPLAYVVGIALAFFEPIVSCVIYALVAVLWLVPDRRLEKVVSG
ncbi:MAG TPA: TMEM175 family protein [Rhodanobacteraceae bacterium]|nr:TMEM175 family protein [Rhodanobacteraceae bacterium]